MESLLKSLNLGVALIKATLFGLILINTIGVILFVIGVGLFLEGMILLAIPFGGLGVYLVIATDDKLS